MNLRYLARQLLYRGEYKIPKLSKKYDELPNDMKEKLGQELLTRDGPQFTLHDSVSALTATNNITDSSKFTGYLNHPFQPILIATMHLNDDNPLIVNPIRSTMTINVNQDSLSNISYILSLDYSTKIGEILSYILQDNKNNILSSIRNKSVPHSSVLDWRVDISIPVKDLLYHFDIKVIPKQFFDITKQGNEGKKFLKSAPLHVHLNKISINLKKMKYVDVANDEK